MAEGFFAKRYFHTMSPVWDKRWGIWVRDHAFALHLSIMLEPTLPKDHRAVNCPQCNAVVDVSEILNRLHQVFRSFHTTQNYDEWRLQEVMRFRNFITTMWSVILDEPSHHPQLNWEAHQLVFLGTQLWGTTHQELADTLGITRNRVGAILDRATRIVGGFGNIQRVMEAIHPGEADAKILREQLQDKHQELSTYLAAMWELFQRMFQEKGISQEQIDEAWAIDIYVRDSEIMLRASYSPPFVMPISGSRRISAGCWNWQRCQKIRFSHSTTLVVEAL